MDKRINVAWFDDILMVEIKSQLGTRAKMTEYTEATEIYHTIVRELKPIMDKKRPKSVIFDVHTLGTVNDNFMATVINVLRNFGSSQTTLVKAVLLLRFAS